MVTPFQNSQITPKLWIKYKVKISSSLPKTTMDTLLRTSAIQPPLFNYITPTTHIVSNFTFTKNYFSFPSKFPSKKLSTRLIVASAKKNKKKEDKHSFVPRPDEATGLFPEAVLLKEKKVQEDGKLLPEFADEEEEKLYEYLNLELQSQTKVDRMRHYEVVYLIHEKHAEEVALVNEKVQDFIREKKGRIWRLNDWGMRRLAYKIQKAKNAHYILMNFEVEAKWINDFKSMLDTDERVIRHLVIKMDEAVTEDCPPPPEFHTLRAGMDDYDDEDDEYDDDLDDDDELYDGEWDGEVEGEMEEYEDEMDENIIIVDSNEDEDDNHRDTNKSSGKTSRKNKVPSYSR